MAIVQKLIASAVFALTVFIASPSLAATDSTYTKINLDDCLVLKADDFGASFACPGYKGYPLYVAEGDLRFFVSYGFGAPDELAAHQTPPAFNLINETLEWRLSNESGGWKPFATILRFFLQVGNGSQPDGELLIVTKLEPGNTCHIAYIDAKKTRNANEVAREQADNNAADFQCGTDQAVNIPN